MLLLLLQVISYLGQACCAALVILVLPYLVVPVHAASNSGSALANIIIDIDIRSGML